MLQVEKLARQFGVAEDVAYTCETAAHFWLLHVLSRWEKFLAQAQQKKTPECIKVGAAALSTKLQGRQFVQSMLCIVLAGFLFCP